MIVEKPFKILSIDGGGIRGIIPAKFLVELEDELKKKSDKKLYEHFDLICGTSTGAILAIGISLGIPAKELLNFYKENASLIFPKWYYKVLPSQSRALLTSYYSNKELRKKLLEIYSTANGGVPPIIKDLKTKICIPTFNGGMGEINVFKTKHHPDYTRDYKLPAHEVALSSASAPVYFPPHSFSYSNQYGEGKNINMIDGGIFANNPTLIGILEATEKLNQSFSSLRIVSLGTGKGRYIIKRSWIPMNALSWLFPNPKLIDITMDSQAQITEQYISFLNRVLGRDENQFQYARVQYEFSGKPIDLNASHKHDIEKLDAIGGELAKKELKNILQILN